MTARVYLRNPDGDTVEITSRVDRRVAWELQERAEEGAVGSTEWVLADPAMDLDLSGYGHLPFWVEEDESEATDNVLFRGFIGTRKASRGTDENFEPLGRVWRVSIHDANNLWNRRVMLGADCNRPVESDVDRVQWLLGTSEFGIFDDVTTYVSTASPQNMDKVDLRRRFGNEVIGDAGEEADKNWWCKYRETGSGHELFAWYAKEESTAYSSSLYLSNDPDDWSDDELAASTSLVWPYQMDHELELDSDRIYTGGLAEYGDNKAVYRKVVGADFRRDTILRFPLVKTKERAAARLLRKLAKMDDDERIIRATVRLPAAKATMIRAGMRIQFKATHLPGLTDWEWLRILSCTIRPVPGAGQYDLELEMVDSGVGGGGVAPVVQWASLGLFGGLNNKMTLRASDDGAAWTTIATGAELVSGVGTPPGQSGPVGGVIAISSEHYRHRYWRITFDDAVAGGPAYFAGVQISYLALLAQPTPDTTCRLGTTWVGGTTPFYIREPGGPGTPEYHALADQPALGNGIVTSQTEITSDQLGGGGYGVGAGVVVDYSISATWTFDLLG